LIVTPRHDIDAVVGRLFGRAVLWAIFVALSMTAILVSTAVQLIRVRARAERERHQLLERELKQAREIQLHWLPRGQVDDPMLEIATVNHPASRISGDFYNWFKLPDGRTAVVIGDVTGHGMAAAFLMATTQLLVRNTLPQAGDPGRCLAEINRQLCTQVFNGQFVTLQILIIDSAMGRVEVSTAGHPPPLIHDGVRFEKLDLEPNLVLGVERDATYPTERFDLSPESLLLLYTDGAFEAESPAGEQFGMERLRRSIDGHSNGAQSLIQAVLDAVDRFRAGRPLADDLTLVAVQLQGRYADVPTPEPRRFAEAPATS
ncbi:MAG TPA: PP2C family protein-serine/threonine phosphatase, partial [Tepidisphaeraceae bacterium]|nr:PP2C family protein-serine/threonine phosphatase [Tepidisphaeraceae bacterium]